MRQVIVQDWMTLDGVVQAPGAADEDVTGGFEHGGWSLPYFDDEGAMEWVARNVTEAGGFLLGRRTYEILGSYWPNASEEERVLAEPLNQRPKYVASTTLSEPLDWRNAELLKGDVPAAVEALKQGSGDHLLVIGSTRLVQTLLEHDLVDEFRLMVDPLIVGGGKRIVPDSGIRRSLVLTDTQTTSSGAILATYHAEAGS
jgi:dihydrofolate reductase